MHRGGTKPSNPAEVDPLASTRVATKGEDEETQLFPTQRASRVLGATVPQSASSANQPIIVGELFADRYLVEQELGAGAFGAVYKATTTRDGQRVAVALKLLHGEHAKSGALVYRFKRRELEILRRVHESTTCANVVRCVEPDVVSDGVHTAIVLEYIDGPTLGHVLEQEKMLDQTDARQMLIAIARGIAAIHACDGVHRDLKPENIKIRTNGEPVILDLGIAKAMWDTQKLTGTHESLLTPRYASPEQLSGGEVGPASDVYSLGLMGFEMLTGTVPLAGRTLMETIVARTQSTAPSLASMGRNISEDLIYCINQCLQRAPEARPSAAQVEQALQSRSSLPPSGMMRPVAVPNQPLAPISLPDQPAEKPGANRKLPIAIASTAAVVAIVIGVAWQYNSTKSPETTPNVSPSAQAVATQSVSPAASASVTPLGQIEMPSSQIVHKAPLRATLRATKRTRVILIAKDATGAGALLLPCKDVIDPVVTPEIPLKFPDIKPARSTPVVAQLEAGQNQSVESLVAIFVEDEKVFSELLPKSATKQDLLPMKRDDVTLMIQQAKEKKLTIHSVDYQIVRKKE